MYVASAVAQRSAFWESASSHRHTHTLYAAARGSIVAKLETGFGLQLVASMAGPAGKREGRKTADAENLSISACELSRGRRRARDDLILPANFGA
jgi:hypothetical protein